MSNKLTTEEFIDRAKKVHRNKYDYSKTEYINSKTKIVIVCSKHGDFLQIPNTHLNNKGCRKCGYAESSKSQKNNTLEFIKRAKKIHSDKYNYSVTKYNGSRVKVKIFCPHHGIFEQRPDIHLNKSGCVKCSIENNKIGIDGFILKSNKIHNNKYNYKLVKYFNIFSKVKIICPEHGEFIQTPFTHLKGSGCNKCGLISGAKIVINRASKEFKNKAKNIHEDKYNYSLVVYVNAKSKIKILCPKHNVFTQKPSDHLQGQGCPICKESKGERKVRKWLNNNNINIESQKSFKDCKNIKQLHFDFYLPKHNVCIEYNGKQHYESVEYFDGNKGFELRRKRDKIKSKYCNKNNIELIIIRYDEDVNEILNSFLPIYKVK